ncbi:hypothetical protein V1511DRAFT_510856 [Dipodascopsis uninucleata]
MADSDKHYSLEPEVNMATSFTAGPEVVLATQTEYFTNEAEVYKNEEILENATEQSKPLNQPVQPAQQSQSMPAVQSSANEKQIFFSPSGGNPISEKKVLGLRKRTFIIVAIVTSVLIIAVALGAGLGAGLHKKHSAKSDSFPYAKYSDGVCIPDTNILSNANFDKLEDWNVVDGQNQWVAMEFVDGTPAGIYMEASSNASASEASWLQQNLVLESSTTYKYRISYMYEMDSEAYNNNTELAILLTEASDIDFTYVREIFYLSNAAFIKSLGLTTITTIGEFVTFENLTDYTIYIYGLTTSCDFYLYEVSIYETSDTSCASTDYDYDPDDMET